MAFQQIGLGGIFTLNVNPAVVAMQKASQTLQAFRQNFDSQTPEFAKWAGEFLKNTKSVSGGLRDIKTGASEVAGAMGGLAIAGLPVAFALKKATDAAIEFEGQMTVVRALLDKQGRQQMPELIQKAKELGSTTAFSAREVGDAMEFLVRAGATANQTMGAVGGVLAAAAAEGMELGKASDVVVTVVKGMSLQFEQAGEVADYLAKTSALTNSSISSLGESFTYGAATARDLGLNVAQTSAIFGALSDAGLSGSLAGTSFSNMMTKLAKPSKEAQGILKSFGVTLEKNGKMKEFPEIISELGEKISAIRSPMERAAISSEIFGERGRKAFSALVAKGPKQLAELMENVKDAVGASADMAEERLDSLQGRMQLFGAAMKGLAIEVFEPMLKPIAKVIKQISEALGGVLQTVQKIMAAGESEEKFFSAHVETLTKFGQTTWDIALGVVDAVYWMKDAWADFTSWVSSAIGRFTEQSGSAIRGMTSSVIKFVVSTAIFVPIAGVVGALAQAFKLALWPAIQGTMLVAWGFYRTLINVGFSLMSVAAQVLSFALTLGLQFTVAVLSATQAILAFTVTMVTRFATAMATGVLWLALFGATIFTEVIPALWSNIQIELWYVKTVAVEFIKSLWKKITLLPLMAKGLWSNVMAMKAGFLPAIKSAALAVWTFVRAVLVGAIPALIGFVKGLNLVQMVTLKGLLPALLSVGRVLLIWAGPILLIFGLIGAFLASMGAEANSFKTTMIAAWTAIKTVVGGFIEGFKEGAQGIWFSVRRVFLSIYQFIRNIFGFLWEDSTTTTGDIAEMFKVAGKFIADAFRWGFDAIAWFFEKLGDFIFEAQFAFSKFIAAVQETWIRIKKMVGALSKAEYEAELRRIETVRTMLKTQHDERKKQIQTERDALKKLEEDEKRATDTKKAMEKYIYAEGKREEQKFYEIKLEPGSFEVNVNNKIDLDGKQLATSVNRHQQDIQERKGFKTKRWNMMAARESGAPAGGGG
jgi:TP901 family phage tail tape measure protein